MKLDVEYVARLARLKLTSAEIELLGKQLGDILSYIDKLKEVDVEGILPTSHALLLKNIFREDKITPSLDCQEVLGNAPGKKGDFFKVPPILK